MSETATVKMSRHNSCGWRVESLLMPAGMYAWWCTGCLRYLEIWELDRQTRRAADERPKP